MVLISRISAADIRRYYIITKVDVISILNWLLQSYVQLLSSYSLLIQTSNHLSKFYKKNVTLYFSKLQKRMQNYEPTVVD